MKETNDIEFYLIDIADKIEELSTKLGQIKDETLLEKIDRLIEVERSGVEGGALLSRLYEIISSIHRLTERVEKLEDKINTNDY